MSATIRLTGKMLLPKLAAGHSMGHFKQRLLGKLDIIPLSCALSDVAAVVFDWDGVLVDSGRNYYRAYEMVFEELGITTTAREIYLREGQPTPQLIASLCAERGITISDAKVKELAQRRREYDVALGQRTYFPGIWDLVSRLRSAGCKLAMVTGSSQKSVDVILLPHQRRYFDAVVTADDVTRPKPDPQPFLLAAQIMGVEPLRCAVVENAPYGVRAARAAGCRVIGICTTLPAEDLCEADCIVQNHRELESLFSSRLQTEREYPPAERQP